MPSRVAGLPPDAPGIEMLADAVERLAPTRARQVTYRVGLLAGAGADGEAAVLGICWHVFSAIVSDLRKRRNGPSRGRGDELLAFGGTVGIGRPDRHNGPRPVTASEQWFATT